MSCRVSCFVRNVSRDCQEEHFLQENDGGTEGSKTVTGSQVVGSTSVDGGLGSSSGSVLLSHGGRGCNRLGQCAGAVGNSDSSSRGNGVDLAVDGGDISSRGRSRANGRVSGEER